MSKPDNPSGPLVGEFGDGQAGLLAAARLIFIAASEAENQIASRPIDEDLDQRLVEADLKVLLWQAVALLPPGLRLDTDKFSQDHQPGHDHVLRRADLRSALQAAARELRHVPLRAQPAGTSTLLADLTALIARLDPSPRGQNNGREPE
ncbi:MAG: hypothetical protein ACR2LI_05135 [Propionibacteriaceae bacterium]